MATDLPLLENLREAHSLAELDRRYRRLGVVDAADDTRYLRVGVHDESGDHDERYLRLTGGTLTGSAAGPFFHGANEGSGKAFQVGDDAELWDVNVANEVNIRGVQTPTSGVLSFGSGRDTRAYRASPGRLETNGEFRALGKFIFATSAWHVDDWDLGRFHFGANARSYYKAPPNSGVVHEFRRGDDTGILFIEADGRPTGPQTTSFLGQASRRGPSSAFSTSSASFVDMGGNGYHSITVNKRHASTRLFVRWGWGCYTAGVCLGETAIGIGVTNYGPTGTGNGNGYVFGFGASVNHEYQECNALISGLAAGNHTLVLKVRVTSGTLSAHDTNDQGYIEVWEVPA